MTRRASWLDLDHAASSEQPSNAALLGDEERGRMSAGTFSMLCRDAALLLVCMCAITLQCIIFWQACKLASLQA